jgi:hypothetical protein
VCDENSPLVRTKVLMSCDAQEEAERAMLRAEEEAKKKKIAEILKK